MNKITKQNDHLIVPDKVTIPFIEGDGVGAEITPVSQKIVKTLPSKKHMAAGALSNGKKYWLAKRRSIKQAVGCPTKQWMLSANIWSVSKVR